VVAISTIFTQTLAYDRAGVLNIPLEIDSRSARQERLRVQVEGLAGSTVLPGEILLEPSESARHTIAVRLPDAGRPKQGQMTIVLTSPAQSVIVKGGKISAPFKAPARLLAPLLLAFLILAGAAGFLYYRWRQRRRARLMLVPSAPRRVL
jgi:hypothetical protein